MTNLCQTDEIEALTARIAQLELFAQMNFELRESLSIKLNQHRFFVADLRKLLKRGGTGKGWLPVSGLPILRLLRRRGPALSADSVDAEVRDVPWALGERRSSPERPPPQPAEEQATRPKHSCAKHFDRPQQR